MAEDPTRVSQPTLGTMRTMVHEPWVKQPRTPGRHASEKSYHAAFPNKILPEPRTPQKPEYRFAEYEYESKVER